MGASRKTVTGIIVVGVLSFAIATYIWKRATREAQPGSVSRRCTSINNHDYSAKVVVQSEPWIHLNRGDEAGGYLLSTEGALLHNGEMLIPGIPVSAISGRAGAGEAEWIYAHSVRVSPAIPEGRFALLQACEQPDSKGMCWALFVLRLDTHDVARTSAGHYGISGDTVLWIRADDDYAIVKYQEEGQTAHYRIHLATGQSTPCESAAY